LSRTQKKTEQNLIARTEAEVTNNKRLRSRYCVVLLCGIAITLSQSRVISATAELLQNRLLRSLYSTVNCIAVTTIAEDIDLT